MIGIGEQVPLVNAPEITESDFPFSWHHSESRPHPFAFTGVDIISRLEDDCAENPHTLHLHTKIFLKHRNDMSSTTDILLPSLNRKNRTITMRLLPAT